MYFEFAQIALTQNPVLSQFFLGFVPDKFTGALAVVQVGDWLFGSTGTKPVAAPIPSAVLLLGGGLMGIAVVRKRIRKHK